MRGARTVDCTACGARWRADVARFCGWCGLPLRLAPAEATRPPRIGRRVRLLAATLAFGLVAAGAGAAVGAGALSLPRDRSDPAVDLARDTVVPQGRPLTAEERARALAPFDPALLRCAPVGCERWRIDLTPERGHQANVGVLGDLAVVVLGSRITAYDLDTGALRWEQSWPQAVDGPASHQWTMLMPTPDGEVLVLSRPEHGAVLVLDRAGSVLWSGRSPSYVDESRLVGDLLLLLSEGSTRPPVQDADGNWIEPDQHLQAVDIRAGTPRWSAVTQGFLGAGDGGPVVRIGEDAVLLDAGSGAEIDRRPLSETSWLWFFEGVGIIRDDHTGTWEVLERDSLRPVVAFEQVKDVGVVVDESLLVVAQIVPDATAHDPDTTAHDPAATDDDPAAADGDARVRLHLVGIDGEVHWSHDLVETAPELHLCCPGPRVDGDALILPGPQHRAFDGLRLSLHDGTLLPAEPPTDDTESPMPRGVSWLDPDTAIEQQLGSLRLWHAGDMVEIRGEHPWPATTAPPFLITNNRSLISVRHRTTDAPDRDR